MGLFDGVTAGLASGFGNIVATQMANDANMELAKYSYDQQKQMIAEQNAYNSPVEQMKRYEEAGLNPNLIYGSGQASAGNQQSIAKYDAPHIERMDIGQAVSQAMNAIMLKKDLELKDAEIQNRHQQFENMKEEQFKIRAERHSQDIANMWASFETGFDPGLVSNIGDQAKMAESMRNKLYQANIMDKQTMYEYRETQKAYLNVQKEIAQLDQKQKQYYFDEIQPLMRDILEKRSKGLETSNEILKLQEKFFRADKFFGYGSQILNGIGQFISPFKIGGGSPSPIGRGTSRSSVGSVFYDDLSTYGTW